MPDRPIRPTERLWSWSTAGAIAHAVAGLVGARPSRTQPSDPARRALRDAREGHAR